MRHDGRRSGALLTLTLVLLGGALVQIASRPAAQHQEALALARRDPVAHAAAARSADLQRRFDDAVLLLHARQYERAATALHHVLQQAPQMPEAHVNMGFALLGLGRPAAARDFFDTATALKADQANAYFGLALAHEALGDLATATGAMRSYLHLARHEDAAHLRRARAALWEWESRRSPAVAASAAGAAPPR